ncbi:bacillithiol system redox-active protein YtxJ [Bacillus marinisedimentorum]|uniref:bacillithiol system redox-active protein YtxJ n=1 Tax=Bacillus marinisedimentorum TaxID=1821260 RepID=UPI0007DFA911|nr:bacillithiol system redox-active protein YtxJ [Bacillus marinisedimentorum]
MGKVKVETVAEFKKLLEGKKNFLFVKHSLTCPISAQAFEAYGHFTEDYPEVETFYLHVQEARELSNYIAEVTGVKHESPQALLFEAGRVSWNESHWNITYDTLQNKMLK